MTEADDTSDTLRAKIRRAINQCSAENGSDTPDFILAEFLMDCLQAFDYALQKRTAWYGAQKPPWRESAPEHILADKDSPLYEAVGCTHPKATDQFNYCPDCGVVVATLKWPEQPEGKDGGR